MYKRKADGEYAFSGRFWTYVVIATLMIGWIGWRTQETANFTERQAWETQAYAAQTQDCLNQLTTVLKRRSSYTTHFNDIFTRRMAVWGKMLTDLAAIPTVGRTQAERDADSKPILDVFFKQNADLDAELMKVNEDIRNNPIPDPVCGQNLPK